MIELPEAAVLAGQLKETIGGKIIKSVTAAHHPHKFAWYFGDPQQYEALLKGQEIGGAVSWGGHVELAAGNMRITFSDGVNLRYFNKGAKCPDRHQLVLEFADGSFLVGSVQMYGGLLAFPEGENDNKYYLAAREKPSPLSDAFTADHFSALFGEETAKLSLKAFLATEQRIPGVGNGVLQDILFKAGLHPKKKVDTLTGADKERLFRCVKDTLSEMTTAGGRDTETDLFGNPGGYITLLSKNTVNKACPVCGTPVRKEAYLGGSIYFCSGCQIL